MLPLHPATALSPHITRVIPERASWREPGIRFLRLHKGRHRFQVRRFASPRNDGTGYLCHLDHRGLDSPAKSRSPSFDKSVVLCDPQRPPGVDPRARDELDPDWAAAAAAPACPAADTGGLHGQSPRILRPGQARRRARIRHARLLPVLAGDRHAPSSLVQHRDRRRRRRIYRPRQGASDRLPGRARDPGAGLPRLFSGRPRGRARPGFRQHSAGGVLLSVRTVRDLSRAPLPPDADGVARRAILDERLRLGLCRALSVVGTRGDRHPRPRPAVARRGARALQDAPFLLWRPAGQLRGARLGVLQARLVALAVGAGGSLHRAARALYLRCLQSGRMAMVVVRPPLRRRAAGVRR